MRAGIVVTVTPKDRSRLEAIVSDRNRAQKPVARARVLLATDEGLGTMEIMARSGVSKPAVWRWQARYMSEGVDGLLRDRTGKLGKAPLPSETIARVVELTLSEAPGEGFFSALTRRRLKRGVFVGVVDLQAAINRYVREHNANPRPFTWTADAQRVLAAVSRGHQALESLH